MQKFLALVALSALTACSAASDAVNSDVNVAKLQSSTASYFQTPAQNVTVSKLEAGVLGTEYEAHVWGRKFDCHYFRSVVTCESARRTRGSGFRY